MTPSIPAYPNLLRPGSPVLLSESYAATFGRSDGIVFDCGNEKARVAYHEDFRPALIPLVDLRLSLATDTGMCHAARWLAEQLGMDPGATAPGWAQYPCGEHCCNGETGEMAACTRPVWSLGTDEGFVLFMDCPNPEAWDGEECRHVPGIGDLTDPAAALAAACMVVGGAS